MEILDIQNRLNINETKILKIRDHSKASERYIDIIFKFNSGNWKGSIPIQYRRTGLFLDTEFEIADYITEIRNYFESSEIKKFIELEKRRWDEEYAGMKITVTFFKKLLNMKWNSVKNDLPQNPNFARRIQEIKELGYTLVTDTSKKSKGTGLKDTHIMLLPIPKGGASGYEVISDSFKNRAISILNQINIYELRSTNKAGLLLDHKFPEIRWDDQTRGSNEKLTDDEIQLKFQLIDNQRNQQKREACRKCFQTGERGQLFGINYFYNGDKSWPKDTPKRGKDAEKGCIGCGWYDIGKWRESLNDFINEKH